MHRVLILGAGRVAGPLVCYLLDRQVFVTLADQDKERADALIGNHPNGASLEWQGKDQKTLGRLISEHDLTVSFLPYVYHVDVARRCIEAGRNMVTTSYVKPEMKALDTAACKAGITILNEIGLDPGIDHMSAIKIIDQIHAKGGKVDAFYSLCGALPVPESADNPFKYKFSWSPRGVLMAGNSDATYLKNGEIIHIPGKDLFKHVTHILFPGVGKMEVYPNRDSIQYIDIYKIPDVKTMFRGTIRYPGWCESQDAMKHLGLLSCNRMNMENMTFAQFTGAFIDQPDGQHIREKVAAYLHLDPDSLPIRAMEWLGLFSDEPLNRKEDDPFEVVADRMIKKMELTPEDRDMVLLQHVFKATYPDGQQEMIKSRMLDYGNLKTGTSIARTVALPAAIGVMLILEGKIAARGVQRPVIPEIYLPVLRNLANFDIELVEEHGLPYEEEVFLSNT
jgi:saccharopine dehydrogenase (NADP+, L-glutamate forming)